MYIQLKKYGFDCYVLDLIQGPTEILNVLCKINKIHLIVGIHISIIYMFKYIKKTKIID